MSPAPHPSRNNTAFSLLEMVLSLTVLAIVFSAVGSVFVLSAKVIPAPGSALASGVKQSQALSRLVEDLQVARYVTESTANSVTIVVDDRTGDGLPDRLRYAWSGSAGDSLTLSINGLTPATVADSVEAFTLGFTTEERVDTVPGGATTSGTETLLYTYNTLTSPTSWRERGLADVDNQVGIGQLVTPTLPAEVSSYTATRVRVKARSWGQSHGETYVRLYDTDGTLPIGSALAEEILLESDLTPSRGWIDITFASPLLRLAGEAFAVAMEWKTDRYSAAFEFDEAGGSGLLTQNGGTDPWVNTGGRNLLLEVYGTCSITSPDLTMTREVRTHAQVTLQVGDAPPQSMNVRLYCEPGVHSAAWEAGFDASPVGIDFTGDGTDWKAQSGGSPDAFTNGRWSVDGLINTQPAHNFDQPMRIDLMMGAESANRGGAKFRINADQAGGQAVPITVRVGRDVSGIYCVKVYDTEGLNTPRLDIQELGGDPPAVRLLIAPSDNAVGLIVNGVPAGSFYYTPVSANGLPGVAALSEASEGFFDHVTIRVGGSAVVTEP